jgi:hypothetical protein
MSSAYPLDVDDCGQCGTAHERGGRRARIYLVGYNGQTVPVEIYSNVFSGQTRGSGLKLSNASTNVHGNLFKNNTYDGVTIGESNRQPFTARISYNLFVNNGEAGVRETLDNTYSKTVWIWAATRRWTPFGL